MNGPHDVRDRRPNNMAKALAALDGCRVDLLTYASDPKIAAGVMYDVARRIAMLAEELERFRARDLLNMRAAVSS